MAKYFESDEAKAQWGSHYIPGALTNPKLEKPTLNGGESNATEQVRIVNVASYVYAVETLDGVTLWSSRSVEQLRLLCRRHGMRVIR